MTCLRRNIILGLVASAALWTPVLSLAGTASSSCLSTCGDKSMTYATDLVCADSSYDSSSDGLLMKNCLLCQSTSTTYESPTDNDVYWFLFNQKYTLQTCLFDRSAETSLSPCESSCLPLKSVLKTLWFSNKKWASQYDYCDINGGAFVTYAEDCASCLKKQNGSVILGNFMDTLDSGCQTKPNASDGDTIHLRQALFATTSLSTTSTTATTSATKSATTSTTASPTTTSAEAGDKDESSSSGLSTGAAAGIGVGAGAGGLIVIVAALWFFCLRKRREKQVSEPWNEDSETAKFQSPPASELAAPYRDERENYELPGRSRVELP